MGVRSRRIGISARVSGRWVRVWWTVIACLVECGWDPFRLVRVDESETLGRDEYLG